MLGVSEEEVLPLPQRESRQGRLALLALCMVRIIGEGI
jgi:hypothetical protein